MDNVRRARREAERREDEKEEAEKQRLFEIQELDRKRRRTTAKRDLSRARRHKVARAVMNQWDDERELDDGFEKHSASSQARSIGHGGHAGPIDVINNINIKSPFHLHYVTDAPTTSPTSNDPTNPTAAPTMEPGLLHQLGFYTEPTPNATEAPVPSPTPTAANATTPPPPSPNANEALASPTPTAAPEEVLPLPHQFVRRGSKPALVEAESTLYLGTLDSASSVGFDDLRAEIPPSSVFVSTSKPCCDGSVIDCFGSCSPSRSDRGRIMGRVHVSSSLPSINVEIKRELPEMISNCCGQPNCPAGCGLTQQPTPPAFCCGIPSCPAPCGAGPVSKVVAAPVGNSKSKCLFRRLAKCRSLLKRSKRQECTKAARRYCFLKAPQNQILTPKVGKSNSKKMFRLVEQLKKEQEKVEKIVSKTQETLQKDLTAIQTAEEKAMRVQKSGEKSVRQASKPCKKNNCQETLSKLQTVADGHLSDQKTLNIKHSMMLTKIKGRVDQLSQQWSNVRGKMQKYTTSKKWRVRVDPASTQKRVVDHSLRDNNFPTVEDKELDTVQEQVPDLKP